MSSIERMPSSSYDNSSHANILKLVVPTVETSPVGIRMIESCLDIKSAKTLASLDVDSLNVVILKHLEITGNEEDLNTHNSWVVGHKSSRLIRIVERLAARELLDKEDNVINNKSISIPLINDQKVLWSEVEPMFRNNVSHSLSRLMGVDHQPINFPEVGHSSVLQLGWIAIKNSIIYDLNNEPHISIYDFAVV